MNTNTSVRGESSKGEPPDRRVELWVQPVPELTGEYGEIVRKLGRLQRRDAIDEFDVRTWNRYVPVDSRDAYDLDQLRHWTWRHGGDQPEVERRVVGVGRMGPVEVVERTPSVVLAEFRNGALDHVTPCEGGTDCVLRRLAELERLARVRSRLTETRQRRKEHESRGEGTDRPNESRERERLSF